MMYKNLYRRASEMADMLQERQNTPEGNVNSAFVDKATQGLVRRRQDTLDSVVKDSQEGVADLITNYISRIRASNPADQLSEFLAGRDEEAMENSPARDTGTWDYNQVSDFAERLAMSESSGRSGIQIQTQSGGRQQNMTGLFQFSDARLEDYMNDTGASFSTEDFRQDPDLQRDVFAWHINDIDRVINSNDLLEQGYDLDGLRAVAHLGGINGMLRYARSGGEYNPADEFGTSLSDYYARFSGQE